MASVLKHWREAATLFLVAKSRLPQATGNFEVLMLKRSVKSKFMPSVHVFPGGVAHDSDFSPEWLEVFNSIGSKIKTDLFKFLQRGGPGSPMFSREREEFSAIPSELAFRICAIRETFEESGILLVRDINTVKNEQIDANTGPIQGSASILSDTILLPWRHEVHKDAWQFVKMCQELKVVPDVWSLYEWSNWLTPIMPKKVDRKVDVHSGRRFDTAFFICILNYIPHAAHDEKETVALQWSSPQSLIEAEQNKLMKLAPPQMVELSRLRNFSNSSDLHKFAWKRSCQRVVRWFPVPCACDDGVLYLYPGDDLYPAEPDYEGSKPVMSIDGTVAELAERYPNHNRSEIILGENSKQARSYRCNVQMKDGQVNPVLDPIIPQARL